MVVDVYGEDKQLKEIQNDLDALKMAMTVGPSKEACVYVKLAGIGCVEGSNGEAKKAEQMSRLELLKGVEEDEVGAEDDLEDILVSGQGEGKLVDEENDLHDSDYSINDGDTDVEDGDNVTRQRPEVDINGELGEVGSDGNVKSDYARSEQLQSCSSTDEDELVTAKPRYAEFNNEVDIKNPQFKIGMKFGSFKQFREAVRSYGIKNRYVMKFKPNNKKKCKAFCTKGCPFYLWASPMVNDRSTIQIKTGNLVHECTRDHVNRHVNAQWIANTYLEQFRADPSWKLSGVIQAVKTNQEVDISRLKAYRAKCIAQRIIDGDEESQMARLHDFELLKTHPGSAIIVNCNDEGVFEALYVCLAPLREGFLAGCRHLISVDGCFLKGLYGGQLLCAVGIDANDCIYPISWAMVKKENKDNWKWFFEVLAEDLRITDSKKWAFILDRQKGLMPAIAEVFPYSEHRYCVTYIHTNFKKTFRGKALKDQLWACARASYYSAFEREMEILKVMSIEAYEYMKKIEPKHWSKSHFQSQFKCDILLNNLCECFNSNIVEARIKGIITMNEMIRTLLMKRIKKRRDAMQKVTTMYCPRILKKLEKFKQASWLYTTIWSGGDMYQVGGPDGQFVVKKKHCCCSCRKWQLSGVPCSHAISVLYYNNEKAENYLDKWYKVSTYMETYAHILYPTHDRGSWPRSGYPPVIPPEPVNKRRGRKTLLRRKEIDEQSGIKNNRVNKKGVKMKCNICGTVGHNKRFHGTQANKSCASATNTASRSNIDIEQPFSQVGITQGLKEPFSMVIEIPIEGVQEGALVTDYTTNQGSQDPLSQVVIDPLSTYTVDQTLAGTQSRITKLTRRGGKKSSNIQEDASHDIHPQRKHKNAAEGTRARDPEKRKRVWLPPGAGAFFG
ncbi:uncharacterized protein LOC120283285 [Dioscorea cayenensis subsp. rotundata]|uniref:Uncharacterized protein LOC120283285 n=1 Tax=Dioscorea cayennensis subsp. rotundata TaxID=55577 RepID=A0AB40D0R1_DIOCR|nr:uncharacterized protein LOC120283285 [Dioscorea cayenensis subsp. rotundata]XP_039145859.1 uncharacterized protein LOC120283285 [Dioscorea cayenensis subsp. rotundata]XP_039145860.1 uncharacterized protein LOC120283285 [Dioscorea cayenensis subsp. rotundata]